MKPVRVLLADDHNLVRAGIRALLQNCPEIEVVAEAADGREALRLIEVHKPNVALLDIAMPQLNGLETTARVTKEFPEVRVVMLSMHATEEYVLQALRVGASGYLLKGAATTELEAAILAVARGETYLSSTVSKHVVEAFRHAESIAPQTNDKLPMPVDHLTPRQREVLQLIAEGFTTKEIAQKLNISVKTVKTHRINLMKELNMHDVAGLVRYAIRVGISSPDE